MPTWVKTEDRRPTSEFIAYLIWDADHGFRVVSLMHDGFYARGGLIPFEKATYWMPIPEPPEGE